MKKILDHIGEATQPPFTVYAPQHCLAPQVALAVSAVVQQAKAMARVQRHVGLNKGDMKVITSESSRATGR